MLIKPHIRLIYIDKFKAIGKGVNGASVFCLLYASTIGATYWICVEHLKFNGATAGAIFAYLTGCSLFVRENILKIIQHIQSGCEGKSAPLENISSIVTVALITNIILLYFFSMF